MAFDVDKFRSADMVQRTDDVKVPGLSHWFKKGEKPAWTVRGLTFEEIAKADAAAAKNATMLALIESMAGDASVQDQVEKIKDALGFGADMPEIVIKRLEMLVMGSVTPPITLEVAVKLSNAYPVEFKQLTDKVIELTGLGQTPGKPRSSGRAATSKAA